MPDLRRPNLESKRTGRGESYVTVYSNRSDVGISEAAFCDLGASGDHYLHLAFDRTWAPFVGAVEEQTPQQEPTIQESNLKVTSSLMCQQLLSLIDGNTPDGSVRFYFDGKTIQDEKTGATLHRLEVPEA